MSKILLVSDNEVLNSLYSVNFKVYTNLDIEVETDLEKIIDIIVDDSFSYSAVISLCMIGDEDTALLVYHNLIENGRFVPFTVVGNQSDVPDEVVKIKNSFDIKGIIQSVSKGLGITAQDMVKHECPDFYPMPIRMFFPLQSAPCDTFYKIRTDDGEFDYLKIFKESEGIWPKIKNYLDEGVHVLYIPSKDRFSLTQAVTHQLIDDLNGITAKSSTNEKLEVIEQGIEVVAEQIFEGEMTKQVIELSNKCMDTLKDVIDELPDLKGLLRDLSSNKSGFLYSHSIIAGFVASHILDEIDWGGESHKDKLKFVLFFHDMYLVSIYKKFPDIMYEESLLFDEKLSEADKEIVISHANEAAEALKRFPKCPIGVDVIIRQHHGTSSGLGFATSYKDDISPLAKVLIISEAFTEELLKTIHSSKKVEIPKIVETLIEKFKRHTYTKIVKHLENIKL